MYFIVHKKFKRKQKRCRDSCAALLAREGTMLTKVSKQTQGRRKEVPRHPAHGHFLLPACWAAERVSLLSHLLDNQGGHSTREEAHVPPPKAAALGMAPKNSPGVPSAGSLTFDGSLCSGADQ